MFYSDYVVLKLCIVFLRVITMAKQAMLFDSPHMAFNVSLNWSLCLQIQSLYLKSLLLHKFQFSIKKV